MSAWWKPNWFIQRVFRKLFYEWGMIWNVTWVWHVSSYHWALLSPSLSQVTSLFRSNNSAMALKYVNKMILLLATRYFIFSDLFIKIVKLCWFNISWCISRKIKQIQVIWMQVILALIIQLIWIIKTWA